MCCSTRTRTLNPSTKMKCVSHYTMEQYFLNKKSHTFERMCEIFGIYIEVNVFSKPFG